MGLGLNFGVLLVLRSGLDLALGLTLWLSQGRALVLV